MTTRYKRTLRRRFWTWYDDCAYWYDRNHEGLISGFVFGVLCVVIVFEVVWSI